MYQWLAKLIPLISTELADYTYLFHNREFVAVILLSKSLKDVSNHQLNLLFQLLADRHMVWKHNLPV